jgi:transposase
VGRGAGQRDVGAARLKAADLKPHRIKTFKVSNDLNFADKVVDIVGLYINRPSNALVLCVDERSQIHALDRTQPGLPLSPGRVASPTHDYKRNGTACLFAAFDVLSGRVIGKMGQSCKSHEFLGFMKSVEKKVPKDKDLHIVLDNLSAHKTREVNEWLAQHPRVHFHFTPTSSSWLNAVEGWFAQLERRALYRGVFTSVGELIGDRGMISKKSIAELRATDGVGWIAVAQAGHAGAAPPARIAHAHEGHADQRASGAGLRVRGNLRQGQERLVQRDRGHPGIAGERYPAVRGRQPA